MRETVDKLREQIERLEMEKKLSLAKQNAAEKAEKKFLEDLNREYRVVCEILHKSKPDNTLRRYSIYDRLYWSYFAINSDLWLGVCLRPPLIDALCLVIEVIITFTPPESSPSSQFWGIYALIGGVRDNNNIFV